MSNDKADATYHPASPDSITMWCIYDHPSDHPNHFVVREWKVEGGINIIPDDAALFDTLEAARASLPAGVTRFNAMVEDDPVIVEVWM